MALGIEDADPATQAMDVNSIGDLEDMGHIVGDDHDDDGKAAGSDVPDELQHTLGFPDTECGHGFVHDDDLGAECARPGHGNALPLTAGEGFHGLADVLDGGDPEQGECFAG